MTIPTPVLLNRIIGALVGAATDGDHPDGFLMFATDVTSGPFPFGYVDRGTVQLQDEYYEALVTIQVRPRPPAT